MDKHLKIFGKISGVLLIVICILVFIPLSIDILHKAKFGFGHFILPLVVPLSFTFLFGILSILGSEWNQEKLRRYYIGVHLVVAASGLASMFVMPMYSIALFALILVVLSIVYSKKVPMIWHLMFFTVVPLLIGIYFLVQGLKYGSGIMLLELLKS